MQALSEEDRRLWMEAMDGREPVGCRGYRIVPNVRSFPKRRATLGSRHVDVQLFPCPEAASVGQRILCTLI